MASRINAQGALAGRAKTMALTSSSAATGSTGTSVSFDGDGGATITSGGKATTYGKNDLNVAESEAGVVGVYETETSELVTLGGSIEDYSNGTAAYQYMMPVVESRTTGEDQGTLYYSVVGMETPSAALESKANATYSGRFISSLAHTKDPSRNTTWAGDVNLNADFEDGTLDGELWADGATVKIPLNKTDINGNGFSTNFAVSADDATLAGQFEGKFYGNEAQEAGGTMSYELNDSQDRFVGSGIWAATQDGAPGS